MKKRKIFKSFQSKLWLYFVIFTAIIFSVLWLLQIVFLQNFYNAMLIRNTQEAARQIISSGTQPDINRLIDEITHDNAFLVYITDENGKIYYSSDQFKENKGRFREGFERQERLQNDEMMTEKEPEQRFNEYRMLPVTYDTFLQQLTASESGTVAYSTDSSYVYGAYMDYYGADDPLILYISVTIDTMGPAASILSSMLMWVTVLSVLVAFVLSWFLARRFARPVHDLSEKAKQLGEKEYTAGFRKGFCAELDALSDTLDTTNEKLHTARSFQMELMANVSHDLRTPLTMIKGYAEMIQDISWSDEQQCRSDLNVIIKEADRLTACVNEILEYSELQTEESDHDFEPVNLSLLLNRAADSFDVLYQPEKLVLKRDIQSNVMVMGKAVRLERAVYNLLDNAARHTGDSKKVLLTLTTDGQQAIVSVTDYGKGIPPQEQEHIWDRYYTSRQRGGKGVSGLGLAIVRQIVTLHQGECSVASTQGKGSTFMIKLKTV